MISRAPQFSGASRPGDIAAIERHDFSRRRCSRAHGSQLMPAASTCRCHHLVSALDAADDAARLRHGSRAARRVFADEASGSSSSWQHRSKFRCGWRSGRHDGGVSAACRRARSRARMAAEVRPRLFPALPPQKCLIVMMRSRRAQVEYEARRWAGGSMLSSFDGIAETARHGRWTRSAFTAPTTMTFHDYFVDLLRRGRIDDI